MADCNILNPKPVKPRNKLIQLKITTDLKRRRWEGYAGAAGAGKFLPFFVGEIPKQAVEAGEAKANLYALNRLSRLVLNHFKGARVVSIVFDSANVNAPIARLELRGDGERCLAA